MPLTGILGSSDSTLSNFMLGGPPPESPDTLVETVLEMSQHVTTNFDDKPIDDTLSISQSVTVVRAHVISVESELSFDDFINGTIQMDNETELGVDHSVHLQWDRSISDVLSLVSTFNTEQHLREAMTLVSDADVEQVKPISHTLAMQQALSVSVVYNRALESEIALDETLAYFLPNDASECNYSPFTGGGDTEFTPPDTTAPVLGSATLTLTYPYVSPSNTLVLRNPDFGNADRLAFQRINRTTRGGTLIVFADTDWPKQQVLSVTVSWLSETEAQNTLAFLRESLGQEIGLLDWENRLWRGIITTPDAAVTQAAKHNRVISFEFEGELA